MLSYKTEVPTDLYTEVVKEFQHQQKQPTKTNRNPKYVEIGIRFYDYIYHSVTEILNKCKDTSIYSKYGTCDSVHHHITNSQRYKESAAVAGKPEDECFFSIMYEEDRGLSGYWWNGDGYFFIKNEELAHPDKVVEQIIESAFDTSHLERTIRNLQWDINRYEELKTTVEKLHKDII